MAFTNAEIENIMNSALEFYVNKGKTTVNEVQAKPMKSAFEKHAKTFSGGNGEISVGVRSGKGGGQLRGYEHDDTVSFYNPTGNRRASYTWKLHHIGLGVTEEELLRDGIDLSPDGKPRRKDGRSEHVLSELLETKIDELDQDWDVSFDKLLHEDGSSDAKAFAGIGAFLLDDPAAGVTGGIDRALVPWWRNRAATAAGFAAGNSPDAITSDPSGGGQLMQFLQGEQRQLGRYAPKGRQGMMFAGWEFMDAIERELRANGMYSQAGFNGDGIDGGMAPIKFGGRLIHYDPTLDDMGLSKRMLDIDMEAIHFRFMRGMKKKITSPARPYDRFVHYRSIQTTGAMVAKQLNTSGVYDIK